MDTPTRRVQLGSFRLNAESSDDDGQDQSSDNADDVGREDLVDHSIEAHISTVPSVDAEMQEEFLKSLYNSLSARYSDLSFSMASGVMDGVSTTAVPVMLIAQRTLHYHPPYGLVSRVQVSVRYKAYTIFVLMREWKKETFESISDLDAVCRVIGKNKFCPGIEMKHYMTEYYECIRFHIKSVRLSEFPFQRVDSQRCSLLFELVHNASKAEKEASDVVCYPCKRLVRDLEHQKKRTAAETPTKKIKRQQPSSKARLSYMSPASQAKRKQLAQYERTNSIRKLAMYEDSEIMLDDTQNEEMCSIVQSIGDDNLESLYVEGEKHGVGKLMKEIWITDAKQRSKQFFDDQAKNSMLVKNCYADYYFTVL